MNPLEKNNVTFHGDSSSSATIIFVHGFGTNQKVWHRILREFPSTYRIVLLDLIGASEHTILHYSDEAYPSYHNFAQDVVDIVDYLSIQSAVIVGHSMGAMISLLAALKRPSSFSGVGLIGASPYYLNDESADYRGGFSMEEVNAFLSSMETNFYSWVSGFAPVAAGATAKSGAGRFFADALLQMRPDLALSVMKTVFLSDHRADVALLNIPALILQTQDDVVVPTEVGHFLERRIPSASLHFLGGSGHLPHLSSPEETARYLLSFCNQCFPPF